MNACAKKPSQSDTHPNSSRICMKSKWFLGYVQTEFRSSISNVQFGGTKLGWMGERSVPITWAEGKLSAMSLDELVVELMR